MDDEKLLSQLKALWVSEALRGLADELVEVLNFEHQRGGDVEGDWDEGYDQAMSDARTELEQLLEGHLKSAGDR